MKNGRGTRTRAALLEAAAEAFAQDPYESVSILDVAKRAGVAAGATNYHFGSKRGLYLAVLEADFRAMWSRVQGLRGPSDRRLSEGVDAILDYAQEHPRSFLALTVSVSDPEVRALRDRVREEMFQAFMLELAGGTRSPALEASVAAGVAGAEGLIAHWLVYQRITRADVRVLLLAGVRAYLLAALHLEPRADIGVPPLQDFLGADTPAASGGAPNGREGAA